MKKIFFVCFSIFIFQGLSPVQAQMAVHSIAVECKMAVKLVNGKFQHEYVLTNLQALPLKANWTIYFHQSSPASEEVAVDGLRLQRISGEFYKLEPAVNYVPIPANGTRSFSFLSWNKMLKVSDLPDGFYIVFKEDSAVESNIELLSNVTYTLPMAHSESAALTRERYEDNSIVHALPEAEICPIIPTPVFYKKKKGTYTINAKTKIYCSETLKNEALYLQAQVYKLLGKNLEIVMGFGSGIQLDFEKAGYSEGYSLGVNDNGIAIAGYDAAGVFYGIQSLRALFPIESYSQNRGSIKVTAAAITDHPRFKYRGNHLDVARNFHNKESVFKVLDLMAFYKLNKFQFHLTDDEGWRLEIPGLPELTEVGAKRGHTLNEHDMLMPAYGSGPFADAEKSWGSGFYTKNDFVEILKYAAERHIEIIPEIDFPGHARAAIVSMKSRYKKYLGVDSAKAKEYLLNDLNDQSEYRSIQWYNDNISNVCQESTYHFLEKVVTELCGMYAEAGLSLKTLHTGGDEVPRPVPGRPDIGAWVKSPLCIAFLAQSAQYKEPRDLFYYFIDRFSKILAAKNIATAGWEEIALKKEEHNGRREAALNKDFVGANFTPYIWNTVWGWGGEDRGYKVANFGYKVVLSNVNHLYFDLSTDDDPMEIGVDWGGHVNARKTWEFIPFNMYYGNPKGPSGDEIKAEYFANMERLTQAGRENILGIQGQLWSESVKGPEWMEYMMFPKMISLAERAWAQDPSWAQMGEKGQYKTASDAAWNAFANTLGKRDLPRLEYLAADGKVNYRMPLPGAKISGDTLYANCELPGFAILYSSDKISWIKYSAPVAVAKGSINFLKTLDVKGRESRIVEVR